MADPIWYLGPAGDMRPLECPEPDVNITVERYGGVFQGLSGARSMDVTGYKQRFQFEFEFLTDLEYAWMEALHLRTISGVYRLRNPFKKNLLGVQASLTRVSGDSRIVQVTDGIATPALGDWPAGAGNLGNVALKWTNRSAGPSVFRLEDRYNVPVVPGRSVVFSLYMRASSSMPGTALIDWHDVWGTQIGSSTQVPVNLTTSWQRVVASGVPPAGAVRARPAFFTSTQAPDIYVAAGQVEEGLSATAWESGGGAPVVFVDQLETVSPRFPYRNTTLTILEA